MEYARPPPGTLFGRPLKESVRYASVQISTADSSGRLYVWGYIPVVVAKWCVCIILFLSLVPYSLSPSVSPSSLVKSNTNMPVDHIAVCF